MIIAKAIVMISPVRNSFACGSVIDKRSFLLGTMRVWCSAVNFDAGRAIGYLR